MTERVSAEVLESEKLENSMEYMNGDSKSIDSDIPDLEDCPPERKKVKISTLNCLMSFFDLRKYFKLTRGLQKIF